MASADLRSKPRCNRSGRFGRSYARGAPSIASMPPWPLVWNPRQTLARLSDFLDYDLDYDRIQVSALGRFRESNSSFRGMAGEELISPVQRWKQRLGIEEVAGIEALVGDCLLKTTMSWQRPKQNEGWDFKKSGFV